MIVSRVVSNSMQTAARRRAQNKLKMAVSGAVHRRSLQSFGREVVKDIKAEILKKNKTGKVVTRKFGMKRKRTHQHSSPRDQSHANLHGKMRASLGYKVSGTKLEIGYGVNKRKEIPPYTKKVEMGGGNITQGRHSIRKGIKRNKGNLQSIFEIEMKRIF